MSVLQAREAREKEEVALDHKKRLNELDEGHRTCMAALKRQNEEAEEALKSEVGHPTILHHTWVVLSSKCLFCIASPARQYKLLSMLFISKPTEVVAS